MPDAGAVGHKHLVKQAALGRPGDLDVVVNVDARIGLRARVPPGGNVVARGHDEGAQAKFFLAHVVSRKKMKGREFLGGCNAQTTKHLA